MDLRIGGREKIDDFDQAKFGSIKAFRFYYKTWTNDD